MNDERKIVSTFKRGFEYKSEAIAYENELWHSHATNLLNSGANIVAVSNH